ncbi:MAG TPA: hypothetical protein VMS71_03455 [Candidatus Acidoferrum sp.]|nr:hypothetical protein [Candidatus Acidoferrum sp.]
MNRLACARACTLIELVAVVVIIGILASVAIRSLKSASDVSRIEQTKQKLDRLAIAIAGDPALVSGGGRTSYGYVGDVGALPTNLDALVQNPGGFTTWKGPYVRDDFTSGGSNSSFKMDAWGKSLSYTGGLNITSTGSGSLITRVVAASSSQLLLNKVTAVVTDLGKSTPGETYKDSVKLLLTIPNGVGSTATKIRYPSAEGDAQFDSIPIGQHELRVVYLPTSDTIVRLLHVNPGQDVYSEISLFRKVW